MPDPIKILEVSGDDWMKGLSIHPYIGSGGLFKRATNFDPFRKIGIYTPSQGQSRIGAGVVTIEARWIVPFSSSSLVAGVTYFYAFGSSTLYLGRTTQGALPGGGNGFIEDQSSRLSSPWFGEKGAIKFKDKIVYISTTGIAAGTIPLPATPSVTKLLGNLTNTYSHFPHIGPDRNLYVTNGKSIAKITNVTGTSDNEAEYLTFENDVVTRGITNDGQHLIITGDGQGDIEPNVGTAAGRYRCFVAFWNMKGKDLTRIWEFEDNHVSGATAIEDEIIVFGSQTVYKCNVNSRPLPLLPKGGNSRIQISSPEPGSINKVSDSIVLWSGEGYAEDNNDKKTIFGYGRLHPSLPKSLFTVHTITGSPGGTATIFSLFSDSGNTGNIIASYGNSMYIFTGTNNTSTIVLAGIDFKQPYEFSFAKVVLNNKLDTGQSVDIEIISDDIPVVRNTQGTSNSFNQSNFSGKKSHIFFPYPGATASESSALFENLTDIKITNVGADVKRFEIWAEPVAPDQDIYK